ncbi:MAG: hypothetical protein M1343_08190 [Chloroflexi bacterium]|nr:hypothetical protein [Chloroflexota bacterium]
MTTALSLDDQIIRIENYTAGMMGSILTARSPEDRQRCERMATEGVIRLSALYRQTGRKGVCHGRDYPRCCDPKTVRPCIVCQGKQTMGEYEAKLEGERRAKHLL